MAYGNSVPAQAPQPNILASAAEARYLARMVRNNLETLTTSLLGPMLGEGSCSPPDSGYLRDTLASTEDILREAQSLSASLISLVGDLPPKENAKLPQVR